jgi:hypothetical protein
MLGLCLLGWAASCTPSQVRYEPLETSARVGPTVAVLYLVGDAGEASPGRDDVLRHLRANIDSIAAGTSAPQVLVAFLGDNIYDEGLPAEPSEEDLLKLGGQVQAVPEHANVRGVFLPGNHDWANGASVSDGRAAVERQRDWIDRFAPEKDIGFLPDDGCPGPVGADLPGDVHLVFIDTEWLLRRPEERCGSEADFYTKLTEHLRAHAQERVVILAHHPLVSGGPHGGNLALLERGPFVHYLARKSGANIQDIASPRYSAVVAAIRSAIESSGTRPLAFAAGHDHTLQVIGLPRPDAPAYQLVSGAGSKSERTRRIEGMRFASDGYGYMRLDFGPREVGLTVFAREVTEGPVRSVFGCTLSADGSSDGCAEAPRVGSGR